MQMKNLVLCFFLLTLAACASAQQTINWVDLPDVATSTPLPTGYHSLNWAGVSYVDPSKAPGLGAGFQHFSSIAGTDVASGPGVCGNLGCYSSISAGNGGSFQLVSAIVAAGSTSESLTVLAYANGTYVGSQTYSLTTDVQTLTFPQGWGNVTEVVLQAATLQSSFVLYSVTIQ
jgi:hypothetical protein